MLARMIVAVVMLVLQAVLCQGFFWGSTDALQLCPDTCTCPTQLVPASRSGIDCHDANITHLPDELEIPAQYTSVDFSRNSIGELSMSTFSGCCSGLLRLDLSDNEVQQLPALVLQHLPSLSTLLLKNNKLTIIDSAAFVGLHNLTRLDLSYNKLEVLPEDVLEPLVCLQELLLGFNPLVTLNPSLFTHNTALTKLDLAALRLNTLPNNLFLNMMNLEEVSLAQNNMTVVPTKALYPVRYTLTRLDLSGNPFQSLGAYSFYKQHNLRTIILERLLHLETIEAYAFGDLHSLETVVFRYMPRIKYIDPKAFHEMAVDTETKGGVDRALTVEDFTFSFSVLATLPEELLPWQHLRQARLEYNHWNCDCQMKWVKTSPLMDLVDNRMVCSKPKRLRGHRLKYIKEEDLNCDPEPISQARSFGFLAGLMVAGLCVSLATVALLVYWRQGWLCRRPVGAYSRIERGPTTITIADELEYENTDTHSSQS
nr:leucine-rich repeat neuronal protein 3-like isoform X2 [Cherax quadricarinatus]